MAASRTILVRRGAAEAGRLGLACLGLAALFLLSFGLGRYPVAPSTVAAMLAAKILPLAGTWTAHEETVVMVVRLPRILAAMMVGAALATAGASFQGVLRNPMVSPDILGVTAGASLGAAIGILAGAGAGSIQLLAFGGGLLAVALTWGLALLQGGRGEGMLTMVLTGIVVGTVFSALVMLAKFVADPHNTLPAITFWLMGGLGGVNAAQLSVAAPPCLIGIGLLFLLRWRMNLLAFGDDEARSLGVQVVATRALVVVGATLATASSVALAGVVGLVGLVVPHLARMVVGANHTILLPASAILGAGFLLVVDDIVRLAGVAELPLGILTALSGAPFFLYLLLKTRTGWER